jgi:hypothetical protein
VTHVDTRMTKGAIGFRARTGRAIAVVLSGDAEAPALVWRGEVSLIDPTVPATAEPYHQVMELPWSEAMIAVQGLVSAIEAVAEVLVRGMVEDMQSRDVEVRAVGVVGSSPRNLERIGNHHIRAHAAEGVLFRRVLEESASRNHLLCRAFSESELFGEVSAILPSAAGIKSTLTRIGRSAGPPWRVDERLAATAAWIAMAN